jgi:putative serine protease PepD
MDEVMPIVDQMSKGETPTHARLGVSVRAGNSPQGGGQGDEGASIEKVNAGSTAANAGITEGDVVTKVDDHLITDADSLIATIRSYRPGDQVTVTYVRGGETKTAELTLDSDSQSSNS